MRRVPEIIFFLSLSLSISFFSINYVVAGESEIKTYTIEESIREAFKNNWTVKTKEEKIEESRYVKKQARADFLPGFSTTYTYRREGEVNGIPGTSFVFGTKDNFQWQGTITQPLFTGFAIASAYELAKLGIDISEMELALEKLDLALNVKKAYISILKADKAVEVAESAVESLKSHLKVARNFYDVGMIPINDLLKAEVELANSEQNLIKARNATQLARASFNTILSRPISDPVSVEDILDYMPESPDFDTYYSKATANRPEIKTIDINSLQIDQQIRLAKSKYYPEIALVYNYTKSGDTPGVSGSSSLLDTNSWQAIASLSWSFWDWGKDYYKVRQAESTKIQLANTKKTLEEGIRLELKQSILGLEETEKRIPAAKKAVEQGEENLRVSQERYKAQVTTSTEVLDAQTQLTQAKVNYYSALYDHHLAKAALLRAVGEY